MENMKDLFDANENYEKLNDPWTTCQALQSVFKADGTPFIFSTCDERYEGVFKNFSKNKMKIMVKKNGDVILFWKSKLLKNEKLRYMLEKDIKENTIGLEGDCDIWMDEDEAGFYFLKMKKTLAHSDDSFDFASEIAYEKFCFLADVNLLAAMI